MRRRVPVEVVGCLAPFEKVCAPNGVVPLGRGQEARALRGRGVLERDDPSAYVEVPNDRRRCGDRRDLSLIRVG